MTTKTIVLACALAATTLSLSAFSQEMSATSGSICTDSLKTICTDTIPQRAQREVYIQKLKNEIALEANANAAPRIEEMKKKISKIRFIKRAIQTFKIRNQELMNSAKKRVGDVESVVTNPENVALLKSYMKQAIDESKFDDTTKVNFKAIMDSITIGTFADYLEKSGLEDNVLLQLVNNACGSDGLVSNAFSTTLDGQRYVLMCPGFLITLSQSPTPEERFNSILHAISHEMGHHLDNSHVGIELYKPYLTCLSTNYADQFKKNKDDQKFCEKNKKNPELCNLKVTVSHAGELIADAWGIKVTAIHARNQHLSFAETDSLLTSSWLNLCGTGDEGTHPTGDFRIGTLLRVNPETSDVLSCDNSAITKPACTLEGAVSI
jgi:hypothetical protein